MTEPSRYQVSMSDLERSARVEPEAMVEEHDGTAPTPDVAEPVPAAIRFAG